MYVFMYVCTLFERYPFRIPSIEKWYPFNIPNFASLLATASALSLKMNVSQNHELRSQRFQDFFTAINTSN